MSAPEESKREVIEAAKRSSMDLVGFASVDRFHGVHYRMRPEAHLDGAATVVSIGMRCPWAMVENAGRTAAESYMSLDTYENFAMRNMVLLAAMDVTRKLEDLGFLAIPMTRTTYRVQPYKDIDEPWTTDFRNDVAAVAAGLGELGLHGVVITPQYGTRQMFTSVVTDAPLEPDPMYDGPALCDRCMKCVEACWMKALSPAETAQVEVGDRTFDVAKKDVWRCKWSSQFMLNADAGPKLYGQDVTVDPPEGEITEADVQEAVRTKGEKGGMQTWYTYAVRECERVCVPPHLRGVDPVKRNAEGPA